MTGFMHEKEFSRKTFLKGGGGLIVVFSVGGSALAGGAQARSEAASYVNIPGPPDPTQVDSWIAVLPDNTVSVFMGKVPNGTGTDTGTLQIAAEELSVSVSQIRIQNFDSGGPHPAPSQTPTVGSNGIASGGPQVRAAAAAAANALLGLASTNLGVPVGSLSVSNGVVSGGGKSVTYAQLIGGKTFNVQMPASYVTANNTITATNPAGNQAAGGLNPGAPGTKPVANYTIVGTEVPRIDIPAKVSGQFTYVHNIRVPGMLHGRSVRPRGQAAYRPGTSAVISVDASSVSHIPGVQVLRRGNFVGVVAPLEYDAIQAAAQLKITWADDDTLPSTGNLFGSIRSTPASGIVRISGTTSGNVDAALQSAAKVVSASYAWPFNIHGVIGPSCALATVTSSSADVFCQFQGGYDRLRPAIAQTLNLPVNSVRVRFYEGSSTYGHNCSDHAAVDAAIMAQITGKPVRVQYMRWDEHGWDNYAPAALIDINAGLDTNGKIVAWDVNGWVPPNVGTIQAPGTEDVGVPIGPVAVATVTPAANGEPYGTTSLNTQSTYTPNFKNWRTTTNSTRMLLRSGTMRGPGIVQPSWASEQMIDELAHAANMDPVAFRLAHITDPRWQTVLTAAAQAANWQPKVAASNVSDANVVTGRGVSVTAESVYAATIADITVNKKTGKIVVNHVYAAQDNGFTVGPDLVKNQMSGSVTQAVSRVLLEEMPFTQKRVTGIDWVTYPILRFKDHPNVTTVLIQRTDLANQGAGESLSPTPPPAVANAFFDATGVRIREAPLSPARVRAALKAAGVE